MIIEGTPVPNGVTSIPILPREYQRSQISNLPGIPVPDGKYVFYIRAKNWVMDRLVSDPRIKPMIIAHSWSDLFFGSYPHWDWIFDFDVTEEIDGQRCRTRRKLAEAYEHEIHGVHVPGIFAGDETPAFPLPHFVISNYQRLRQDTELVLPTLARVHSALVNCVRKNPSELERLQPRQFEELIFEILTRMGWQLELTPSSKDGGYDIFGFSGSTGGVRSSWIIECKKYAKERKVGVEVVRSLCGIKEEIKAANAMLVTTSSFTKGVQDMTRRRWDISLKEQKDILDWVNDSKCQ